MSVYEGKIVLSNEQNTFINFPADVDLNSIAYISSDVFRLPSGRYSKKKDYCCMFCNRDCKMKNGNRCKMLESNVACPNATEVHIKEFRQNSKNDKYFKATLEKMEYLLAFGELSAWAYENKNLDEKTVLPREDIDKLSKYDATKFEAITNSPLSKDETLHKIMEERKYSRWEYGLRSRYKVNMMKIVHFSYINYFMQYADLCSSAAFMDDDQKELLKFQISTVGMSFEHLDNYVFNTGEYYLFGSTFNVYVRGGEDAHDIGKYIKLRKFNNNSSSMATICVRIDDINNLVTNIKEDICLFDNCYFRRVEKELFIRIVNHLAGNEE